MLVENLRRQLGTDAKRAESFQEKKLPPGLRLPGRFDPQPAIHLGFELETPARFGGFDRCPGQRITDMIGRDCESKGGLVEAEDSLHRGGRDVADGQQGFSSGLAET